LPAQCSSRDHPKKRRYPCRAAESQDELAPAKARLIKTAVVVVRGFTPKDFGSAEIPALERGAKGGGACATMEVLAYN
jgi:hypothetical protein